MGQYTSISNMIAAFSGQKNTLTTPLVFIDFMDSLEGGIFLNQLIFWSDKGKDRYGWFYKSSQDWWDEIRLSKYQANKAAQKCKDMGFLKTKVKKANGCPTVHYKLDFDKFTEMLIEDYASIRVRGSKYQNLVDKASEKALKEDVESAGLRWSEDGKVH